MENSEKKNIARPEELPSPTYWPFFLALGTVFMFWGILTTWIISGMGLVLFCVALAGWVTDLFKEITKHKNNGL